MTGVIDGRFRILGELGSGGSGSVYEVADLANGDRILALKVLSYGAQRQREKLLRFRREFRATSRLRHPNIVRVHEFVAGRLSYFTMERIYGHSIARYFGVRDRVALDLNHPRRVALLFSVLHQIAIALDYIRVHQIVHRDLKPENILVADAPADGLQAPKVTIMDFGLARDLRDTAHLTQPGVVLGTLAYVSPEQASGRAVDGRADLYAVGVILYLLLTGELPFTTDTVSSILWKQVSEPPEPPRNRNPGVNRLLESICLRLLRKDPFERYQTPAELLRSVAHAGSFPLPDVIATLSSERRDPVVRVVAPKLTGRTHELRRLRELATCAANGRCRTVLLSGVEGSGRSRLLDELAVGGSDLDVRVVVGRALTGDPRPLAAIGAALLDLAELESRLPVLRESPREDHALALCGCFPELAQLERFRRRARPSAITEPEALRAGIAAAFQQTLGTTALVVAIDSIDLTDAPSLKVIECLRKVAATPAPGGGSWALALVLVVAADHLAALRARWPDAESIELGPISRPELLLMMRSMFGSEAIDEQLVDHLFEVSGGVPGIVNELVRALVAVGGIDVVEDVHRLVDGVESARSFAELVRARVDQVDAGSREILQTASLLRREGASFELLVQATGLEEGEAIDAVDGLLRAGLLVEGEGDGRLRVVSRWVSDAVLYGLGAEVSRELQARLARAVEEDSGDNECELLAELCAATGEVKREARYRELTRSRWRAIGL